jgi:hypothetical protein
MFNPTICRLNALPGVQFAAAELRKYLAKATEHGLRVCGTKTYDPAKPGLWLGLFSDFSGQTPPAASENPFDDEILIRTGPNGGIIAGSNARSVLLAAYRFLSELGFRWVRPGKDGEVIPRLVGRLPAVKVHETASYRHRALCIEGAVSFEHVRDVVDWLPKVGMNGYFIQFREAYNFFQRWYEHDSNPLMRKEKFTLQRARELTRQVCQDIKKRDLILHMVGHGWTCEPFGIAGTGWYQHKGDVPKSAAKYFAEVNGKRELWGGIALNTNLCYGNAKARGIITDAIAEYAREHPEIDIIHFWLADGCNNNCECPLCRDHRPADLYVRMLNELDAKLTRAGVKTKIVFLVYVDLLWPPQKERIEHPDRFILMFAPITRSYSSSFAASRGRAKIPPFRRNKLKFPRDPRVNLAFLSAWQKLFRGDSFDFDYHFMWDHYKDPGYYTMAEVLHEDIRSLRDIGLAGFNSCQVQRAFFPTGLGMTAMARALWDRDVRFKEVVADYFSASFGARGKEAARYLKKLSQLFEPKVLRNELSPEEKLQVVRRHSRIPKLIWGFLPVIEEGMKLPEPAQAKSWTYLKHHAEMCLLLCDALAKHVKGDTEAAKVPGLKLVDYVRRNEPKLHHVLDVNLFLRVIPPLIGLRAQDMV